LSDYIAAAAGVMIAGQMTAYAIIAHIPIVRDAADRSLVGTSWRATDMPNSQRIRPHIAPRTLNLQRGGGSSDSHFSTNRQSI
jgi:hypothetical protein